MRMVSIVSRAVFFGAIAVGASPSAAQLAEPKGDCGGSYFQDYVQERGRKAFAYAEDSAGRYACGYTYQAGTGDAATTGALGRVPGRGVGVVGASVSCG